MLSSKVLRGRQGEEEGAGGAAQQSGDPKTVAEAHQKQGPGSKQILTSDTGTARARATGALEAPHGGPEGTAKGTAGELDP